MSWTIQQLQSEYNLTQEDVIKTLKACNLSPELDEYSEDQISSQFQVVRSYFDSKRTDTYTGAADLFAQEYSNAPEQLDSFESQQDTQSNTLKSPKSKKLGKPLDISQMLSVAAKQTNTRISLAVAAQILEVCGLPNDLEQYTPQQCDRFLEACKLIFEQGLSHTEVATHFGINLTDASTEQKPQIVDSISDSAAESEAGLVNLVDRVTEKRAENIPQLVNQMYLKNVTHQLVNSQDEIESFYASLEGRILEQIEGKSPLRKIMGTSGQTTPLPPSSNKPMQLPPESENGTSID